MKYCDNCKVNVHHQLNTCPLCGRYLDEKNDNDKCAIYPPQDEIVSYPILKGQKEVPFFKSKFNVLLLAVMAFLLVVNFVTEQTLSWSWYSTLGGIFVLTCVMLPINRKLKLTAQIRIDLLVLTIVAVCLELIICKGAFYWFVVEFVLPWLYVAALILVDFLLVFSKRKGKYFSTLIFCTFFALLPQITLWICAAAGWYQSKTTIDTIVFFACLLHFVCVAVVLNKYLKEAMERRLNM